MRLALVALVALGAACGQRSVVTLRYHLGNIDAAQLIRLETFVSVDPADGRAFYADQPYRSVAKGVGIEVADFDKSGKRRVLITHDSTVGYVFSPTFTFTLLPPSGEAAPPLEIVARAVGASAVIGGAPQLKASFGPARVVDVVLMDERCGGTVCAAAQACCGDACTAIATDARNCGACGHDCGTSADGCAGGTCRCAGGSACSGATVCCGGIGCVDLSSDPFNCGACGHACNPGEACLAGQCACDGGAACGAGGLCCAGSGCSTTGSCPCGSVACAAPAVCCDATKSECVNLKSDNQHCGACDRACTAPLACANGACACKGQVCNAGDACCATGCAHLADDLANCGACGHACNAGETCTGGVCLCGAAACKSGQSCCSGACVDTTSDSLNCGACGKLCNPNEQCASGVCQCPGTTPARACVEPPEGCCPSTSSGSGGCFDLTSSNAHCGSCNVACQANQQCVGSQCVTTSCTPSCTNNNTCTQGECRCNGSGPCDGTTQCCSTGCVDTTSDPNHCGNCSTVCASGLCCGSACADRNDAHCQSCTQGCAAPASGGNVFCCGSGNNWSCVVESAQNCGGCGKACLTGQLCCGGACKQESDSACGPSCTDCTASGGICCNHACKSCIAGLICVC